MAKRKLCQRCDYPTVTCMCEHLRPVSNKTRLIVLQHPSEVKQAKNTVKLLHKMSNNIDVFIGESEDDFTEAKQAILNDEKRSCVLYPGDQATVLSGTSLTPLYYNQIIVIDGTWKKATKIMKLNPWLLNIDQVKLTDNQSSLYGIRKTSVKGGLSTLEAAAQALQAIEGLDPTPFIAALEGLKENFTKLMPENVRKRYR